MSEHHAVTLDDLVGMAWAVYDQAMKGAPITDENGQALLFDGEPHFAPDLVSANQAIENIGKLYGFWIERREIVTRTRPLAEWSEDELRAERERLDVALDQAVGSKVLN